MFGCRGCGGGKFHTEVNDVHILASSVFVFNFRGGLQFIWPGRKWKVTTDWVAQKLGETVNAKPSTQEMMQPSRRVCERLRGGERQNRRAGMDGGSKETSRMTELGQVSPPGSLETEQGGCGGYSRRYQLWNASSALRLNSPSRLDSPVISPLSRGPPPQWRKSSHSPRVRGNDSCDRPRHPWHRRGRGGVGLGVTCGVRLFPRSFWVTSGV